MIKPDGVLEIADAYRASLVRGSSELRGSDLEVKLLRAIVARSASDTSNWIITHVPHGKEVAKPLDDLIPALEQGNLVGKSLTAVQSLLRSEAMKLVYAAVGLGAWPIYGSAVAALLLGVFLNTQEAGFLVGTFAIPLVLSGGAITVVAVRALSYSGRAVHAAAAGAERLWTAPDAIGARAQRIFSDVAAPALLAAGIPSPTVSPVLSRIRGGVKLLLVVLWALLAVSLFYFLGGVVKAYEASRP